MRHKSFAELNEHYSDYHSRCEWTGSALAYPGFDNDYVAIHQNVVDLTDYIDFLRDELANKERLTEGTRQLLGLNKREVLI